MFARIVRSTAWQKICPHRTLKTMKISRLEIKNFAIEESPTINEQSVEGRDLLLSGGNRSGKTLIFNALLYGLFGRSGTFGILPGNEARLIFTLTMHILSPANEATSMNTKTEFSEQTKALRSMSGRERRSNFSLLRLIRQISHLVYCQDKNY